MSSVARTGASVVANVRAVTRDPFTITLLLLMPVVSIQLYGLSVGSMADLGLFDTAASLPTVGRVTGAVFAASALTGILGLFQRLGTRTADHRLVVSGYRRRELVAAHVATVVVTALVVAAVTTASLEWTLHRQVGSRVTAVAGLALVGVLSGLVGVFVGTVLPRALEGSLVLVAFADVGAIVASGLFGIDGGLAGLFPLTHPHELVMGAVVDGTLAAGAVAPALGHLLVVAFLAGLAYSEGLPTGGDTW